MATASFFLYLTAPLWYMYGSLNGGDSGSTGMLSLELHVEVPSPSLNRWNGKINADYDYALAA